MAVSEARFKQEDGRKEDIEEGSPQRRHLRTCNLQLSNKGTNLASTLCSLGGSGQVT